MIAALQINTQLYMGLSDPAPTSTLSIGNPIKTELWDETTNWDNKVEPGYNLYIF
jgi:hypothetical protein